ncbi:metal-dependent hydrolase [Woeseia oceani]|uniref:Metal-dependent hydrolase n=1 Tax=Woeseia oceani TaxID=1548547 RepID=A0A193LED2_9GAMM|nr:metal-dependent hydrolase [Woeseia oceani]ANO50823.1 hypothetical protein BA177_06030 [Woeseia oceani]
MNGPAHQFAGTVAAMLTTQFDSEKNCTALHHPAAAAPIGAFLGKLPDMLEPSFRNPNHRQFFHSVAVLGFLGVGMHKLYRWHPQDDSKKLLRALLLIGGAAYLSHLALDAMTSRSLPLLGKI